MSQMTLDLPALVVPEYEREATIAERFAAFHAANPHVADALEKLADQWLARQDRIGVKALFEILRWQSGIQSSGDVYVLNNNYTAHYARLLIERHPSWGERINVRELRAA